MGTGWVPVSEVLHLLLLEHAEQVHEDILFVLEILVEASLGNAAVGNDTIGGCVLKTILGELFHGGVDNNLALFEGEVKKCLFGHNVTYKSYDPEVT